MHRCMRLADPDARAEWWPRPASKKRCQAPGLSIATKKNYATAKKIHTKQIFAIEFMYCTAMHGTAMQGNAVQGNETRVWHSYECQSRAKLVRWHCIAPHRRARHGIAMQRNAGCSFARVGIPGQVGPRAEQCMARHCKAPQGNETRDGHSTECSFRGFVPRVNRIAGQCKASQSTATQRGIGIQQSANPGQRCPNCQPKFGWLSLTEPKEKSWLCNPQT